MDERARVLLVDDEPKVRDLLERHLRNEGYACIQSADGLAALEAIDHDPPDLVITDIKMPRMDGMELLRRLTGRGIDLPVVVITSMADVKMAVEALSMGAAEYLMKPFNLDEVTIAVSRAIEHHRLRRENRQYQVNLERMVREKTRDLIAKNRKIEEQTRSLRKALKDAEGAVNSLVAAIEAWDGDVSQHNTRVKDYAMRLGQAMGLTGQELYDLHWGALFHDVGKIAVPQEILNKPGRLTAHEWEVMKIHPIRGYRIVSSIPSFRGAAKIVLYHHERFDGTGYLSGRKGEQIPQGARIFSVADTFDAMTSARPYKKPSSFEVAFEEIRNCAGGQFDPEIVETFLAIPTRDLEAIRLRHEDGHLRTRAVEPDALAEAVRRVKAEA